MVDSLLARRQSRALRVLKERRAWVGFVKFGECLRRYSHFGWSEESL